MKLAARASDGLATASILIAAIGSATCQPALERVTQTAGAGKSADIGNHARWDTDCASMRAPQVTIERPPRHGSVCFSNGPVHLVISRSGAALNCIGRTIQGLHVIYSPNPAFSGVDTLRYRLDAPEGRVYRDISIMIEPDTGSTRSPAPLGSAEDHQNVGPMPSCQSPSS